LSEIESTNYRENFSVEELVNIVKTAGKIYTKAAIRIIKDETGLNHFIIMNAILRIINVVNESIKNYSLDTSIDDNSFEAYHNKSLSTYQKFFGEAIQKLAPVNICRQDSCSRDVTVDERHKFEEIKDSIINAIHGDIISELENTLQCIERSALEYIKPGNTILTVGYSNTVLNILKRAHEKNKTDPIHVIVTQGPDNSGEKFYKKLKSITMVDNVNPQEKRAPIDVCLITDSSIYTALTQGVDMVLLGAKLVLGDGSCVVSSGTHNMAAICAKSRNIPVIVVAGTHKFSPIFADDLTLNHGNVMATLDKIKLENKDDNKTILTKPNVEDIIDPKSDLICAKDVSLLMINDLATTPSFVYRKLSEMYPKDATLEF